ncbi:MAG: uridine kinase [Eubacteriales bacterium]
MHTYFIGLAGGTASGKTTIVRMLDDVLSDKGQIIYLDSYYHSFSDKTLEERKQLNYDHPDSFDFEALVKDIKSLKAGKSIQMPVYDYVGFTRSEDCVAVDPCPVIIVEGMLVLWYPELRELLDLKIYIDTADDERLIRRIRRDTQERGRSLSSILDQYQTTVKPMHEQFIGPSKKYADIIIPRGAENENGVRILKEHIRTTLKSEEMCNENG